MDKLPGATVSVYVYFRDENKALFDPDVIQATIYKPDGSPVQSLTANRVSQGKYMLDYTLPQDAEKGVWFILVYGAKGSYKDGAVIPVNVLDPKEMVK